MEHLRIYIGNGHFLADIAVDVEAVGEREIGWGGKDMRKGKQQQEGQRRAHRAQRCPW